jgi:tetratricopeptide (TPR) repeat protein
MILKKRFLFICHITILLTILPLNISASGFNSNITPRVEKITALPELAGSKEIDFSKEPLKYMAEIQKDWHFWKIDEGIDKTKKALTIINKLYADDPNAELNDPGLKLNKAYQIKSTLHTLLGMLYHRKSLIGDRKTREKAYAPVLEKVKRGEKFTEEDLEKVAKAIEKESKNRKNLSYFESAKAELLKAIETDPSNPAPHYQLGKIYAANTVPGQTEDAEREFYLAAELSLKEGDKKAAYRSIEVIRDSRS